MDFLLSPSVHDPMLRFETRMETLALSSDKTDAEKNIHMLFHTVQSVEEHSTGNTPLTMQSCHVSTTSHRMQQCRAHELDMQPAQHFAMCQDIDGDGNTACHFPTYILHFFVLLMPKQNLY